MLVLMNHREFTTESNKTRLSIIRFCRPLSATSHIRPPRTSYLVILLQKHLIVFAQSHAKYDGCNVFKTVYPFFPFTSLATYIEHALHMP